MVKSYESKLMNEMPLKGKGVYTKEMRIANLAKARLARGKKGKAVKGKGITSQAQSAVGTASGRGITSQADTAVGTASGKGYYTQDYVPSDQLNFMGNPLDNMDYAKIRARREDKRKKGEYTYSKEMAVNDMPIPTVSGSGKINKKTQMQMLKHKKAHRTYEEEMVNDGYMPQMAVEVPNQYSRLMRGSGWNDFLRSTRQAERGFITGVNFASAAIPAYQATQRYQRATPSSMPMGIYGRQETPNYNYTQTSGLYEPINEGWQVVEQPYSDRPNRSTTSIGAYQNTIPEGYEPYSDRPERSAMVFNRHQRALEEQYNPPYSDRPERSAMSLQRHQRALDAEQYPPYSDRPERSGIAIKRFTDSKKNAKLPTYNPYETTDFERGTPTQYEDKSISKQGNWKDAEATLQDGREAKKDTYYQPPYDDILDANNARLKPSAPPFVPSLYDDVPRYSREYEREMYNADKDAWAHIGQQMKNDEIKQTRRNTHRAKREARNAIPFEAREARMNDFTPNIGLLTDMDFTPTRAERQRANDLSDLQPRVSYTKELKEKASSILKKKKKNVNEDIANRELDERLARASKNRFFNVEKNVERIQEQDRESARKKVNQSILRKAESKRKLAEANALKKNRISEERIFKEHLQEPKGTEQDVIKRSVGRPRKVKTEGEAQAERLQERLRETGLKKKNVKEPIKIVLKKNVKKPKY